MKHLLLLVLTITTKTALAQTSTEIAVLNAEKARFAAQVAKDYATLDRLIGDDLYYQHSNGEIDTKTSFIQVMKEGKRSYDDINTEESKVRVYGQTAIINGICMYYRKTDDGKPNNLHLRYSDMWVKRKTDWQMVNWQSFRLNPTP